VRRNKVIEFVETSSAMIYASELVQLHPRLPRPTRTPGSKSSMPARDVVSDLFVDSGTDQAYGLMVFWAHIYPSMFGKVMTSDHQVGLEVIQDPADLGVWRERLGLDRQAGGDHASLRLDVASFERPDRQSIRQGPGRRDHLGWPDRKRRAAAADPCSHQRASRACSRGASGVTSAPSRTHAEPVAVANEHADVVPMAELWIRERLRLSGVQSPARDARATTRTRNGPLKDHEFEGSGEHEWEWRKVLALGDTGDRILWFFAQSAPTPAPAVPAALPATRDEIPLGRRADRKSSCGCRTGAKNSWTTNMFPPEAPDPPPTGIIGMASVDGEKAKLLFTPEGVFTMPPAPQASIQRFPPDTPPIWPGRIASWTRILTRRAACRWAPRRRAIRVSDRGPDDGGACSPRRGPANAR